MKVIGSITNFLLNVNEQKKLIDRILLFAKSTAQNATLFVSVIISENL
ncbi:MAG: hypothetical protein LBC68_14290 [Prevotellaceae bacterium]|nr:hypothetical protein [Prevotellaceae bacterium]